MGLFTRRPPSRRIAAKIEILPGAHIDDVAADAVEYSKRLGMRVEFKFRDFSFDVDGTEESAPDFAARILATVDHAERRPWSRFRG